MISAAGVGAWGSKPSRTLFALATLVSTSSTCRRTAALSAAGDAGLSSIGTWGGLRARTAGERRHPRQVVILLHGWGAPGDDLLPLADVLAAPGRLFVFPEAPLVSPGGGRAWWQLDITRLMAARERGEERDLREETPPGLAEARAKVTALVAELSQRTGVAPSSIWVGGFSQGAMLATDVALASPAAVGGLVVMSGSLISETTWTARLKSWAPSFPVFQSHGRGDPILPFRLAETLHDRVQAQQRDIVWVPFDGGHEIPPVVLGALQTFLTAHAGAAPPDGSRAH